MQAFRENLTASSFFLIRVYLDSPTATPYPASLSISCYQGEEETQTEVRSKQPCTLGRVRLPVNAEMNTSRP